MKRMVIAMVSGIILVLCSIVYAGWMDGEKVNTGTTGNFHARQIESTWDMCIDDSNVIQIVWENNAQTTEVHYRAKELRSSTWKTEIDVTGDDIYSGGPGHASISTYKYIEQSNLTYKTIIGYASQRQFANEYKRRDLNRRTGSWDLSFSFISPDDDSYIMPAGPTGGSKTGNMITCGFDTIIFAWPYYVSSGGTTFQKLFFRTKIGNTWSDPDSIIYNANYWSRDVCPYPLPGHQVAMAYARSNDNSDGTFNVCYKRYTFGSGFGSDYALTNVSTNVQATMPYVVCRDKGSGLFALHFVWEEKNGSNYRVLYQRYDSTSSSGSWLSHPDTLERTDGRQPSVAVTQDGDIYVVYNDVDENHIYYKYAKSPDYSWSARTEITDDDATRLRWPLVVRIRSEIYI